MQMDAILSRVKNAAKARKAESSSSSNDASTEIIGAGSSESQVSVLDMLLGNSGSTQKDYRTSFHDEFCGQGSSSGCSIETRSRSKIRSCGSERYR